MFWSNVVDVDDEDEDDDDADDSVDGDNADDGDDDDAAPAPQKQSSYIFTPCSSFAFNFNCLFSLKNVLIFSDAF